MNIKKRILTMFLSVALSVCIGSTALAFESQIDENVPQEVYQGILADAINQTPDVYGYIYERK